jgi:hypothetical protein
MRGGDHPACRTHAAESWGHHAAVKDPAPKRRARRGASAIRGTMLVRRGLTKRQRVRNCNRRLSGVDAVGVKRRHYIGGLSASRPATGWPERSRRARWTAGRL